MDSDKIFINRTTEQNFETNLGDIGITFGRMGINRLTHPVSFKNNVSGHDIGTDWISPYFAGATDESGNILTIAKTVGGNHGTVGGGGYATARTVSTEVLVDDVPIGLSFRDFADKVDVIVENEVSTLDSINLDTGDILQVDFIEKVHYVLEHNHMRIKEVTLTAVNPFYIHWYFGLQFTNQYNNQMYFTHDLVKSALYTYDGTKLDSGTKAESPDMTRATMINTNNELVHVYTDKNYGIGYSMIRNNDPIAYLDESNRKFYFHLVKNGNRLFFNRGDVKSYRGGYIFGKNEGANAYVTRFVEDGVQKALVDFRLAATEQLEYTSIEDSVNVTGNGTSLTASTNNAYAKVVI